MIFRLYYPCEKPDETGTTGSLYCLGLAADRLGGENMAGSKSAGTGSDTAGKTLKNARDQF